MAGRRRDGAAPALEGGDALFQYGDGGVGQARIDVAESLEIEEGGGVVDVVEDV